MQEDNENNSYPRDTKNNDDNPSQAAQLPVKTLPIGLRRIVVGALVALGILALVSIYHPNLSERVKFLTGNTLNLLILLVVAIQAYIYTKQWQIMQNQIDNFEITERAYIGITEMLLDLRHGFTVILVC